MANAASIIIKLLADVSDFTGKFNSAATTLSNVGSKMSSVGLGLTAGVTVPLIGAGVAATKTAMDFETQMNILAVAARDGGLSMSALSDIALKVGGDTRLVGINASQTADALTSFYKAGLSTADILGDVNGYMTRGEQLSGALRAAIDLQAASELDLAQSSELVTVAMTNFGLSAEDATRVSNNFVQTADASVASVGDLADAMRNIGPDAARLGFTLEDTNVALGLLANHGVAGAEAGTALKSMLVNMMRPTKDVQSAWQDLGVSLYDSNGSMRDMDAIIGDLSGALSGMTEQQRNQYIQTLAGTYGMKAMSVLLGEGKTGWDNLESSISNAVSAQETANARTKGLSGAVEAFKGALETLMIRGATPFLQNFLTPAVQHITSLIDRVNSLNPNILQLGVKLLGVAAAAGPILFILGRLISFAGLLTKGVTALKTGFTVARVAMAGVTIAGGPLVAVLLLIVGLVALVALAWKNNWGSIREKTAEVWGFIQRVISSVINTIRPIIENFTSRIQEIFGARIPPLMESFKQLWISLQPVISVVLKVAGALFTVFLGVVVGVVSGLLAGLASFIDMLLTVAKGVADFVRSVVDFFTGLFTLAIGLVTGDGEKIRLGFDKIKTGVVGIVTSLKDVVVGLFQGLWNTVSSIVDGMIQGIVGFFQNLYNTLVGHSIVPDLVNGVISRFTNLKDTAARIFGEMLSGVTSLVTDMKNRFFSVDWASVGSGIMNSVKSGILSVASALASAAASVVTAAINAAKAVFGGASSAVPSPSASSTGGFGSSGRSSSVNTGSGFGGSQTVNVYTNSTSRSITQDRVVMNGWAGSR